MGGNQSTPASASASAPSSPPPGPLAPPAPVKSSSITDFQPLKIKKCGPAGVHRLAAALDRQDSLNPEGMRAMLIACSVYKQHPSEAKKVMELHNKAIGFDEALGMLKVKDLEALKSLARLLISLYTMELFYRGLNAVLRQDDILIADFTPFVTLASVAFRSDLKVLPNYKGRVYRGLHNLSPKDHKELLDTSVGETAVWLGFTSTSTNASTAAAFKGAGSSSVFNEIIIHHKDSHRTSGGEEGDLSSDIKLVPGDCASISHFPGEAEVLLPPGTVLRLLQSFKDSNKMVWETCEYPSVWDRIEDLDDKRFAKFAKRHPEIVGAPDCKKSFPNAIAASLKAKGEKLVASPRGPSGDAVVYKKRVEQLVQKGINLFTAASKSGANLNEKAPDGSVPLSSVASTFGTFPAAYHEMVGGLLSSLSSLGASPSVVVGDRTIAEQFPIVLKKAATKLGPAKWEYFVDDGIDGKAEGWYPYLNEASDEVEQTFAKWFTSPSLTIATKSGKWTYKVDFHKMMQQNAKTGTMRQIRRRTLSATPAWGGA